MQHSGVSSQYVCTLCFRLVVALVFYWVMGLAPYRLMYLGSGSLVAIALVSQASYATFRLVLSLSVSCASDWCWC